MEIDNKVFQYYEKKRKNFVFILVFLFLIFISCLGLSLYFLVFFTYNAIYNIEVADEIMLLVGVLLFLISILLYFIYSFSNESFVKVLTNIIMKKIINEYFDDFKYKHNKSINIDYLLNTKLFDNTKVKKGSDLIKGSYQKIPFNYSYISLYEKKYVVEVNSLSSKRVYKKVSLFQGTALLYDLPIKIDKNILISTKKEYNINGSNKKQLFLNCFNVVSENQELIDKLTSVEYQITYLDILKRHNYQMFYYFFDNHLLVGLDSGINYLNVSVFKKLKEKNITNIKYVIKVIRNMIIELDLQNLKF
jgi:uncharacterized membrane protein (DUF485 family)